MSQLPVYAVYTQSHEALVREFFLPSLPGDVDLRLSIYDVDGPGNFLDDGFIRTIRHKLDLIIESVDQNEGKVIFGATVTLINQTSEETKTYQIVGEDEASIKNNKISVTAPIARAMIGKYEGDEVMVRTPDGDVPYEIETVEYI